MSSEQETPIQMAQTCHICNCYLFFDDETTYDKNYHNWIIHKECSPNKRHKTEDFEDEIKIDINISDDDNE